MKHPSASKDCEHLNFDANVSVGRITKGEGGPVESFMAHVKIKCMDCGRPFQFLGLPLGLDMRGAMMDVEGQEARLAIAPLGTVPQPLDGALARGFRIRQPGDH